MTSPANPAKPNVLAVLTNQQRWDTVGSYGSPMENTPTIDELAKTGCLVEQAFTPQPSGGPAHAAFQTGKHGTETGFWRNSMSLSDETITMGEHFAAAGYDVGYVGCWRLAAMFDEPVPADRHRGYEDYWVAADVPEFTTQPEEGMLFDAEEEPVEFDAYRADAFTDYAVEAVESLTEPFLLVVSYLEPHHQNDRWSFVAPEGYTERYQNNPHVPEDLRPRPGDWYNELPDYYGMVERLDECLDRLLQCLDRTGVRDETVVAYTSDHGCHFRTRPGEYKRTPHESSIRVPMVFSGPGFDEASNISSVVSLLDVLPTLLDAAGLDIPEDIHGETLLPVARGECHGRNEVFVQVSESQIGRALRTDRWKYAVAAPKRNGWRSGNGEPASKEYVERYFYDLYRDPSEQVNLISHPEYQDVTEKLRERLLENIRAVEGTDPAILQLEKGYPDY